MVYLGKGAWQVLRGIRALSRLAAVAAAGGLLVTVSACSTGTTASQEAGPSVSPSATAPTTVEGGHNDSASPLPTYSPDDISTVPAAASGGSSVQLEGPCDSGTETLKAYPEGNGVAMTATLRNTAATTWGVQGDVSPELNPVGEAPLPDKTARNGVIVVKASNLTGSSAVGGVSHAWPQVAEADLLSQPVGLSCSASVYLDRREAKGDTPFVTVDVRRSGSVEVQHGGMRAPGTWQVRVTAESPAGIQAKAKSVSTKETTTISGDPYYITTSIPGFTNLRDFTSVTVTVSKNGKDRTWLTLSRTP